MSLVTPFQSRLRRAPSLSGLARRRRFWARLLILSLLCNLAIPGLAQAWVSRSTSPGNQLVAICTSAGIRMISAAQLAGLDADQPAPGYSGHCDGCPGSSDSGLTGQSTPSYLGRTAHRLSLAPVATGTPARPPVMPGARTRAPPGRMAETDYRISTLNY